ncbi:MAG: hypothetical protein Q9M92_06825 [Enterobacterales bacterium]|nr:hypothetical protein [Enterobacterales bacterium]
MSNSKNYFLLICIFSLSSNSLAIQASKPLPQSVELKIGSFILNIDASLSIRYVIAEPHESLIAFIPKNKADNYSKPVKLSGIILLENANIEDYFEKNKSIYYRNQRDNTDCYYTYLQNMDLLEALIIDDNFTLHILDTMQVIEKTIDLKRYCNIDIKKLGRLE